MLKAYVDLNKENFKEIKETNKIYINCSKKNYFNYETIMNVKNLNIKNIIKIPNDLSDFIEILKQYKNFTIQKNSNKKNNNSQNEDESKENKYIELLDAFNDIVKKYPNKEINFKEIVEDENFRKILNTNDYGNIEINDNENMILSVEEKDSNDMEKMEEEFDMDYIDDSDNYDDYLEGEEDENEFEYDDVQEDYNVEDINFEKQYNYVMSENKRMEQNENKQP